MYTVNASSDYRFNQSSAVYDGDISCEMGNNNAYKSEFIFHCVNKTDLITFLSW